MSEVQLFKTNKTNVFGLSEGQAELYKYILECHENKKPVDLENVCTIYYTYVAKNIRRHDIINGETKITGMEWFKNAKQVCKENGYSENWVYQSGKQWLKANIGTFVLRGMLTVIPKFIPKQIEE